MSATRATEVASRPRRGRKPSRKEQLLKVAVELFYERGYHATGIDDIGQAAGITGPGIYRHFTGKEAILSTALEIGMTQILTRVDDIVSHAATPEDALKQLIRNFVRATLNDPALASILLNDRRIFTPEARELVAQAERHHLNQWLRQFKAVRPDLSAAERRMIVYATTGLLAAVLRSPARMGRARLEQLMQEMAEASLFGRDGRKHASTNGVALKSAAGRARRSPRPRRRELILQVAAEMFAERGFADTGIDDIGAAAGITGPGVYRHFTGKEDLLQAVIDQAIERLILVDEAAALSADGDPKKVLNDAVAQLVNDVRDNSALARVAWNELRTLQPDAQARLLEFNRLRSREWVRLLSRVRPDTPHLELLTVISGIYGMLIETTQHEVGLKEERIREALTDMALRVAFAA